MRFNRAYELTITPNLGQPPIDLFENDLAESGTLNQYQTNQFIISHPVVSNGIVSNGIGIRFDVERGINVINNKATIEIYNLNKNSRRFLVQDIFSIPFVKKVDDKGKIILDDKSQAKVIPNYRLVNLNAGYIGTDGQKKIFDRIFVGNLMEGGSGRQGTEIITKLYCIEGGFFTNSPDGFVNESLNEGATLLDYVKRCLNALGLSTANLKTSQETKEELNNKIAKTTLIGDGLTLLRNKYGLDFFIDNGVPYILKDNEALESLQIPVINSDTGLIGSPFIRESVIEVKTMFEPRIKLGYIISLESSITTEYNGQYKVIGIKHQGIISPSQDGDLITTLQLFRGDKRLGIKRIQE